MQKLLIKIICCVVVFMMIFSFAGCGPKKAEPSGTSAAKSTASTVKSASVAKTTAPSQSATEAAATSEEKSAIDIYREYNPDAWANPPEEEVVDKEGYNTIVNPDKIDFGGRTMICTTWDPGHIPKLGGIETGDIIFRAWKAAEVAYNCKFEWEVKSTATYADDFTSAALAGVKYADVYHTQSLFSIPRHTKNNLIMPLDDIVDFNGPLWANTNIGTVEWNGKHYGFPRDVSGYWGPCVLFNKDIFTRDGLPDPLDLFEANQWTWDTMLDIAKQSTVDLDGDGQVDTYGLSGWFTTVFSNLVLSNGAQYVEKDGGNLTFNLNQPELIRAFQFANDLYNTYKVVSVEKWDTFYTSGQTSAMMMGEVWYSQALTRPNGMSCVGVVPLPMGPDVSACQNWEPVSTFNAIQSGIPDAINIVKMMNDISTIWDTNKPEHFDPVDEFKLAIAGFTDYQRDADIWFDFSMKNPVKLTNLDGFSDLKYIIDTKLIPDIVQGTKSIGAAIDAYQQEGSYIFQQYLN